MNRPYTVQEVRLIDGQFMIDQSDYEADVRRVTSCTFSRVDAS